MHKPFRENRLSIQEAFIDRKFLIPLSEDDLPLEIIEHKNKSRNDRNQVLLKNVLIRDTPVGDKIRPKSWFLNLEMKEPPIFAKPEGLKTTESALIVLGCDSLLIFLIEMKTSLHSHEEGRGGKLGIDTLKQKIEDTISRISMLLPLYVFGKDYSNIIRIQYKALVFYNVDDGLHQPSKVMAKDITKDELYQIWQKKRQTTRVITPLRTSYEVECFFSKTLQIPTPLKSPSNSFSTMNGNTMLQTMAIKPALFY